MPNTLHNVNSPTLAGLTVRQRRPSVRSEDVARFWGKVRKSSYGCWEWTASRMGGRTGRRYGQYSASVGNKRLTVYAHRVSWEMAHGPIPDGLCVLHRCDNGICVRPDHLFLGTHTDNMQDAAKKGRLHVPRPSRQKLSDSDVAVIVARVAAGERQRQVAEFYGVSVGCVSQLVRCKRRQTATAGASESSVESSESMSQRKVGESCCA